MEIDQGRAAFDRTIRALAAVPKKELLAEERKYEAAKRRRKLRAVKKKS